MRKYALVLLNYVIDIVYCEIPQVYPPDFYGNPVTTIECEGYDVKLGMSYKDGFFHVGTENFQDIYISEIIYTPPREQDSDIQQVMQAITDAEFRDLIIQQNQELLAQQMADIELMFLGGDR